ncbi:MAG: ABC transporter ATP-binding protein [Clostridia bacterium]|nr:ABC transporter ATP-binding protein [Clostridia bacterium]
MLEIQDLSFSYGKKKVLDHLSLTLQSGEILAVMGASGCGKSTLLNLIAGLRKPTAGRILLPKEVRISYAFQEPRLFPWLTVSENLRAVLTDREDADHRIAHALAAVSLSDAAELYPDELSGGMNSRASLARAIAYGGNLFLLDEPFAALNEELRAELCQVLRREIHAANASAIIVTHQLSDAEALADRILKL